jgi:hypothetical protein
MCHSGDLGRVDATEGQQPDVRAPVPCARFESGFSGRGGRAGKRQAGLVGIQPERRRALRAIERAEKRSVSMPQGRIATAAARPRRDQLAEGARDRDGRATKGSAARVIARERGVVEVVAVHRDRTGSRGARAAPATR